MSLDELRAWAREAKASGEILDWDNGPESISVLTDQGWCPAMYGSDTEPEPSMGCDPREDLCINFRP